MGKIHNLTPKSLHCMLNLIYVQTYIDVDGSACLDPELLFLFFSSPALYESLC